MPEQTIGHEALDQPLWLALSQLLGLGQWYRYPQQIDLEETLDWKAKIVDAYKASTRDAPPTRPSFCDGASLSVIARMEELSACRMPMSLRSLLSQTDGVKEELEIEHNHWMVASIVIYSVDEMIDTNLFMRREYRDRKNDRYWFFSTAGTDGIQFGMPADLADRQDASVFAWYPDGTPDKYMADGLLPFLQGWCAGLATV